MTQKSNSYLSPKLEIRVVPEKNGKGVFALQKISKDELIGVWSGIIVDYDQVQTFNGDQRSRTAQVEEGLYLHSPNMDEPPDFINHSCDPNIGFSGQIVLVAMRDIAVGEEVCFDYAMCDGSQYDEFPCGCGSVKCRGKVTGNDWRLPELWKRYEGYFMPYLQRRIDALKK